MKDQRAPKAGNDRDASEWIDDVRESTEPEYLAWRDAKVRRSLERSKRGNEPTYTVDDVRARYGIKAKKV